MRDHHPRLWRRVLRRRGSPIALVLVATSGAGCGDSGMGPGSGSCGAGEPLAGRPALTTTRVASGFESPLALLTAPGDRQRLFVVEQPGRVRILRDRMILPQPFIDLTDRVESGDLEQGLLGLAFHPRYVENGRFFVHYTDRSDASRIVEFRASSDPDRADAATAREVLVVERTVKRHNGGTLAFGPDGFLYIGFGDGSFGGDPEGNAQNLGTLFGKILRIDVDAGMPYAVPADNPFVGRPGARPEIWAFGLRNPWRFAFDDRTGDLFIGDVGQGQVEEVNLGLAGRRGGENYGWNLFEGTRCFNGEAGCSPAGLTPPVVEYAHSQSCAVIGGVVYRGCRMPDHHGTYFYSDYCRSFLRSFRVEDGVAVDHQSWTEGPGLHNVTALGSDADGEVYLVDQDGELHAIVPAL